MFETQPLRSHALYLFIKRFDLVVKQGVLRSLCVASTQFIERLLNGEFVDLGHDCCLRRRKAKQLRIDNRRTSLASVVRAGAPDKAASPPMEDRGTGRSNLIGSALACAGCSP